MKPDLFQVKNTGIKIFTLPLLLHVFEYFLFGVTAIASCSGDVGMAAGVLEHDKGMVFIGVNRHKGPA